jgi:hypothetical protein
MKGRVGLMQVREAAKAAAAAAAVHEQTKQKEVAQVQAAPPLEQRSAGRPVVGPFKGNRLPLDGGLASITWMVTLEHAGNEKEHYSRVPSDGMEAA